MIDLIRSLHSDDTKLILRQSVEFHNGTNLDCADASARDARGDSQRFIEIISIDQKISAKLFASLRKRSIRNQPLSLTHLNAGSGRSRMQRRGIHILPIR